VNDQTGIGDATPTLLDPDGRPIDRRRMEASSKCPRCFADRERRVLSGGFGEPHDVCGKCGHDFPERTL
jgi:uncharacterized protein (DUF983 family)